MFIKSLDFCTKSKQNKLWINFNLDLIKKIAIF